MNYRAGRVKLDGQPVGIIEETDSGTRFTYYTDWVARPDAVPVSLTMPLRAVPYESKELHPFFENLLPEGSLLQVSVRALNLPWNDRFGLLLATCGDCIGAVEIEPLTT